MTRQEPAGPGDEPGRPGQRRTYPLNRGWRYSPAVVEGSTGLEFDDSAFNGSLLTMGGLW